MSALPKDLEASPAAEKASSTPSVASASGASQRGLLRKSWAAASDFLAIEAHGVAPVSAEHRTDANFFSNFTIWLTMNATISCFSTGALGPYLFGLSMRDSFLLIAFLNLFSCAVPAYVATFGPVLGLRTMTIARYSFGYYAAVLPAILNLLSFLGFSAVNAIAGGQALAAVREGLSINVGIVIICVVSMVLSFCGYKVLHAFERFAYIPIVFAFIMLAGFGGRRLGAATSFATEVPATAGAVLSFASIIIGFTLSWAGCSADFNTYMRPDISSWRVFSYTFAGLYLPCALLQMMGAAFGAAALSGQVTTWETAFEGANTGALIDVALQPLGGFGKFLLVILALGIITNNAPTIYAFSLSLQVVVPVLVRLPRFILPLVATAIYLPIAIVGAAQFASALSNFLGLLGAWISIFVAIFLAEHFVFRKGSLKNYPVEIWDRSSQLPPGIAAATTSVLTAAVVVTGMDQVYWRGWLARAIEPEAHYGGEVTIELGLGVGVLLYVPLRWLEKRYFKR